MCPDSIEPKSTRDSADQLPDRRAGGAPNFLSVGFFGIPNIGDELLSFAVWRRLKQLWPESTVAITANAADVSRSYSGIEAEFLEGTPLTPEFVSHLGRHLSAAARADLVVIGGGGLIADRYAWSGMLRFGFHAAWSVTRGGRFVLIGIGALEIERRWMRPVARFLCGRAAAVYCRDESSAERVRRYGERDDVRVAPDLGHMPMAELAKGVRDSDYALVNIREVPAIDSGAIESICAQLLEGASEVVMLAAEPTETDFLEEYTGTWNEAIRARLRIVEPATLKESVELIGGARVVIGERFHVNLIASHADRRLGALLYEEKVAMLVRELGEEAVTSKIAPVSHGLGAAALALPEPDWQTKRKRWIEESTSAFDDVVRAGLESPAPSVSARLSAAVLVIAVLVLSFVRTPLIYLKRMLLGRGNLDPNTLRRRINRIRRR